MWGEFSQLCVWRGACGPAVAPCPTRSSRHYPSFGQQLQPKMTQQPEDLAGLVSRKQSCWWCGECQWWVQALLMVIMETTVLADPGLSLPDP